MIGRRARLRVNDDSPLAWAKPCARAGTRVHRA